MPIKRKGSPKYSYKQNFLLKESFTFFDFKLHLLGSVVSFMSFADIVNATPDMRRSRR